VGDADPNQPALDVPLKWRELPGSVADWRLAAAADEAKNAPVVQPRIEAVLTACKLALQDSARTSPPLLHVR
jgi:hypothetical protein